ncbi:MAG TPA: flippase [Ignavibacteriaceae bacterium]|nr:flippase [Ignavibacteriaceae bacterium]
MTESSLIKRNSFFSLLSMSSRLIANVIVFWLIARIYGPDTFGTFTFAHTTATLLILLADFGFDILLTTEISRDREQAVKIFQNIFSYKIIFSVASVLIMWIFSFQGNYSYESRISLWIFSFFILFTTLTNFSLALIKGFEKFSYESVVLVIANLSLVIIVIVLSFIKVNILIIAIAFVLTRLFGLVFSVYYDKKLVPDLSFRISFPKEKELHKKVLIFGFHLLFANLFFQIDTILLSLWKGNLYVGIYQAVFKLIILPLMIPDILNFTLLPVLSRLFATDREKAIKISFLMNKLLFFLALPITLILFVYAEDIINIIYGYKQYSDSIPILKIFAFNIFIRFSFEAFALMLTTNNRQIIRMTTVILATIINLALNYLLIPEYGVNGAATVSLISIIFVYGVYSIYYFELLKKWYMNFQTPVLVGITILMGYILLNINHLKIYFGLPLVLVIFIIIGFLFYFSEEDRRLLFSNNFNFLNFIKKS